MNRRAFLEKLLAAGAGQMIAPSMVWPFRKIFLPPAIRCGPSNVLLDPWEVSRTIWTAHPDQVRAYKEFLLGVNYYQTDKTEFQWLKRWLDLRW
jgi:hypothetical protein